MKSLLPMASTAVSTPSEAAWPCKPVCWPSLSSVEESAPESAQLYLYPALRGEPQVLVPAWTAVGPMFTPRYSTTIPGQFVA